MSKYIYGGASDKGKYRKKNQDRIFCSGGKSAQGSYVVACLCDGIGSYEFGEIAAEMVTDGVELWEKGLAEGKLNHMSANELIDDLTFTLVELNELVYERKNTERIKLGCTMSILLIIGRKYHIWHMGDSRIYFCRNNLVQITEDEVSYRNGKKMLANYIARNYAPKIIHYQGSMLFSRYFVLGSDGLFKKLDNRKASKRIRKVTTNEKAEELCRNLITEVEELDEKDNVSAIIVARKV